MEVKQKYYMEVIRALDNLSKRIENLERKIECMFVLNSSTSNTFESRRSHCFKQLPKLDNKIIKLQQLALESFSYFQKICSDNDIQYWISFGTLLGAYRHDGFIPWDDDFDVQIKRSDLDKLIKLSNREEYSIKRKIWKNGDYGIVYSFIHEGICNVDIMPIDDCTNSTYEELQSILVLKRSKMKEKLKTLYSTINWSEESTYIEDLPKDIIDKFNTIYSESTLFEKANSDSKYIVGGIECQDDVCIIYERKFVFPLNTHIFENIIVPMPCCPENILEIVYGNYMKIPDDFYIPKHNELLLSEDCNKNDDET